MSQAEQLWHENGEHLEDEVTFQLRFFYRFDEEVKAFVAYVPQLQVYAQTPAEHDLKEAVRRIALRFILACADRRILSQQVDAATPSVAALIELVDELKRLRKAMHEMVDDGCPCPKCQIGRAALRELAELQKESKG